MRHEFYAAAFWLLAPFAVVAGEPSAPPRQGPRLLTACAFLDATTVVGYVTNQERRPVTIAGPVRFAFPQSVDISRPESVVQTDVIIPPGETRLVARATLNGSVGAVEGCRFVPDESARY